MEFKGTVICHKDKHFGIALVNYSDFRHQRAQEAILQKCKPFFQGLPVVLACQDTNDFPIYYGDEDFIHSLEQVKPYHVIWAHYKV